MKLFNCRVLLGVIVVGCLSLAADGINAPKEIPVNKKVPIEFDGTLGRDAEIAWRVDSGPATVSNSATRSVELTATAPGKIIVACTVIFGDGRRNDYSAPLTAVGPTPPAPPAPPPSSATPKQQDHVNPPPQPPQAPMADIVVDGYVDSGFQGDAQEDPNAPATGLAGLIVQNANTENPHTRAVSTKITYNPKRVGWAALSYLPGNADPAKGWGDTVGLDYSSRAFQSFRVWARGVRGPRDPSYPAVQFKSGDSTSPGAAYKATYQAAGPIVILTQAWREYCIDIAGKDLSNVFSPLTIAITRANNPNGAVFFIEDMHFSTSPCSVLNQ